jgi:hypothetical protein
MRFLSRHIVKSMNEETLTDQVHTVMVSSIRPTGPELTRRKTLDSKSIASIGFTMSTFGMQR